MFSDEFLADRSWNGNEPNRFLLNMGDGTFVESARAVGLADRRDARGLAVSDFDGDGDLDFIVNNYRARPGYYVNQAAAGHWLRVRLEGRESNRDGVGAVVFARTGDVRQMRVVTAGESYASQFSRTVHFGLAGAERVDELEIRWPSGVTQRLHDVVADRVLVVEERSTPAPAR